MTRALLFCVGLCLIPVPMWAAEFYVDPVSGSPAGDGSASRPWRTIQEVFDAGLVESRQWDRLPYTEQSVLVVRHAGAPVRAGDTIRLGSGFHGDLLIDKHYNPGHITLAAQEGHTPRLSSLRIRSSSHWTIRGLTVGAKFAPTYQRRTLIDLDSHSWHGPVHDIVVEQCAVRSVADSSAWTADAWNRLACNGMQVDGARMTIRGNHLLNVNFGISVTAGDSLIAGNVVENFAGDGRAVCAVRWRGSREGREDSRGGLWKVEDDGVWRSGGSGQGDSGRWGADSEPR